MNDFARPFVNAPKTRMAARLAVGLAAAAGLSGCLAHPIADVQVDPRSPIAPYVAELARLNTGYPRFSDIPAKPTDVRPMAGYRKQVAALEAERADVNRKTAPGVWTLSGTEAFHSRAESEAGPDLTAPPSPGATEAFAQSQRERATPPPPPQR